MPALNTNIRDLGGIYKRYATSLEKLGIITLGDFLLHIPFRYDDYSIISSIEAVHPDEMVTIRGKVKEINNQYTRSRFTIQKASVEDETGTIQVVWFNQPYIPKAIIAGDHVSLSGKIDSKAGRPLMTSPDYEIGQNEFIHTGRLVPIYPETRGISSKWLRRQVWKILNENKSEIEEFLPQSLIKKHKLADLYTAMRNVHFPASIDQVEKARKRLSFDELFLIQAAGLVRKTQWLKDSKGFELDVPGHKKQIDKFIKSLPFKLTNAQVRATGEIFKDLSGSVPMNRLLEGDVGSGKTVVAAIAMYLAHLNGFQSVLMAPTEILSQQHYNTISTLLTPFGLKIQQRTSSKKNSEFDILIGTHAVISKKVKFTNLGLVVIDEQQRFGVQQRSILRHKGSNPHVLTMTATPIPRTIALTLYGDLDLSVLDEMPAGRREIKTWLVPNTKRSSAYDWIKKEIDKKNSQVFIICPFIEESETLVTVKPATKEFEFLAKNMFKNYKLALLHGKLKSKEKEEILTDFKNRKFDILVATPVVEVGIDIPNADIILIEGTERFGLSQLHQLRGRVGRRDKQAYCLLFTDSPNPQTLARLRAMERTNIGSVLAELDLKLRGPGEIYGTRQHGRNFLKIASFSDIELIKLARIESEKIIRELDKYPKLSQKIDSVNAVQVSPD